MVVLYYPGKLAWIGAVRRAKCPTISLLTLYVADEQHDFETHEAGPAVCVCVVCLLQLVPGGNCDKRKLN